MAGLGKFLPNHWLAASWRGALHMKTRRSTWHETWKVLALSGASVEHHERRITREGKMRERMKEELKKKIEAERKRVLRVKTAVKAGAGPTKPPISALYGIMPLDP